MAVIISADKLKKSLEGYSPDYAEEFHHASAVLADKEFARELKRYTGQRVILMNGGTASGKSEFIATQLEKTDFLIFDATLSTVLGAQNKIREIEKRKKAAVVYAIIPIDLKSAHAAFLNRKRKFSISHFYRTHAESRKTLLWIAQNRPEIEIRMYLSFYISQKKMKFTRVSLHSTEEIIAFLIQKQVEKTDIIELVKDLET